jgi:maleylpyruvate isomerase
MPDVTDNAESVGPVSAATQRLLDTAERLDAAGLAAPSRCPGWSRAHVLAHVARNADALTNLLTWAATDEETFMYPSVEARNADIEAGAAAAPDDLINDLRESAARFGSAISQLPEDAWEHVVRTGPGGHGAAIPARRVVWVRLREVEIHHVDLDAGYSPADWPAPFVSRALAEALRAVGRRDDVPPFIAVVGGVREPVGTGGSIEVRGTAPALLAWLTGRADGADLRGDPPGRLPTIPAQAWL